MGLLNLRTEGYSIQILTLCRINFAKDRNFKKLSEAKASDIKMFTELYLRANLLNRIFADALTGTFCTQLT